MADRKELSEVKDKGKSNMQIESFKQMWKLFC